MAAAGSDVVTTIADVGRTGAPIDTEVDVDDARHDDEPHWRSVAQQPPPRLAGQD